MVGGVMWELFCPKEAVWYCWQLNGAAAYIRKEKEVWRIAFKTIPFHQKNDTWGGPDAVEPDTGGPDTMEPPALGTPKLLEGLPEVCAWGKGDKIVLQPRLSPRPYIIRLREKVRVAPGQQFHFTVALPPLLRFILVSESIAEGAPASECSPLGITLAEAMPLTVSQTFFGPDTMNGELGHSLVVSLSQEA